MVPETQLDGSDGLDMDGAVELVPGGVVGEIICADAGQVAKARQTRIAALGMLNVDRGLYMGGSRRHASASLTNAPGIIAPRMGDRARNSNCPMRSEFRQAPAFAACGHGAGFRKRRKSSCWVPEATLCLPCPFSRS